MDRHKMEYVSYFDYAVTGIVKCRDPVSVQI